MDQPLYTETHRTTQPFISLLVVLAIFILGTAPYFLNRLGFIALPKSSDWSNVAANVGFVTFCALIFFVLPTWTKPVTVDYYAEHLTAHSGKKGKTIFYHEIKRIWKGRYFVGSYRRPRLYVEKFPGGDPELSQRKPAQKSVFADGKDYERGDSVLTWTWTREVNHKRHGTPLIIGLISYRYVIHTQDEQRVIELFKKQAPWIEFPPYWT